LPVDLAHHVERRVGHGFLLHQAPAWPGFSLSYALVRATAHPAGCPSGQWERTVNPSRKLQRFESSTRHHLDERPFTCGNAGKGRSRSVRPVRLLYRGVDRADRLTLVRRTGIATPKINATPTPSSVSSTRSSNRLWASCGLP
jgi:hypothetical protein